MFPQFFKLIYNLHLYLQYPDKFEVKGLMVSPTIDIGDCVIFPIASKILPEFFYQFYL